MLTVEWSLNEFSSAHLIKFNTRCEIKMASHAVSIKIKFITYIMRANLLL